jgi:hypothetical protein
MSAPPLPSVAGGAHSTYQPLDALAGQGGAARAAEVHEIEAKGAQVHMADLFGITIKIISAQDLMAKDLFTRSSDPYVKITITDQAGEVQQRKTQVIKKNLAPEWDETFTFVFQAVPKSIKFEVKDWDKLGPSSPLGENTLSVEKIGLVDGVTYAGDLRLEGKNIKKGSLKVFIEGLPIPNVVGRSSNELSGVKKVEDIVSLIDLKVCGASALGTHNHAVFKVKNDPFATVSFGLHKFRTAVVPDTNDPTWDQLCPLWITTSDHNASAVLKISVWDHERLGKAVLIGNAYLKPSTLQANHLYDVKLPLVLEDAANDAQLTVLLQDLNVHHSPAPAAASPSAAVSPNPSGKPSVASPTEAIASAASPYGSVHVTFTVKPREQVESDFYSHMIHDYDTDGSNSMDLGEIAHMLTTIGSHLTQEEIETAFKEVDTEKKGALGVAQLAQLFRTAVFEKKAVLRTLYAVMVYGKAAFDSLLMKGVLQGSNSNLAPDADPTVDNEGTKIMVQDRESGMVVAENIPSYIKSALVLLNRSWAGKLAHNKLKGTIRKLTIRQGRKMNDPKSKADIPNFVRIHRLNLAEVELPLEQYQVRAARDHTREHRLVAFCLIAHLSAHCCSLSHRRSINFSRDA